MYRQLYTLANRKDTLKNTAETLRAVAALLEVQNPIVNSITTGNEESDNA